MKTNKSGEKKEKEPKRTSTGMEGIGQILLKYDLDDCKKRRYISQEFQDFAYKLALELEDSKNVPMYMKIAKNTDRAILEQALSFVTDAKNVKNKARLFLWKMKEIKNSAKQN